MSYHEYKYVNARPRKYPIKVDRKCFLVTFLRNHLFVLVSSLAPFLSLHYYNFKNCFFFSRLWNSHDKFRLLCANYNVTREARQDVASSDRRASGWTSCGPVDACDPCCCQSVLSKPCPRRPNRFHKSDSDAVLLDFALYSLIAYFKFCRPI